MRFTYFHMNTLQAFYYSPTDLRPIRRAAWLRSSGFDLPPWISTLSMYQVRRTSKGSLHFDTFHLTLSTSISRPVALSVRWMGDQSWRVVQSMEYGGTIVSDPPEAAVGHHTGESAWYYGPKPNPPAPQC